MMMNASVSNDLFSISFVMSDGKNYITLLSKKELGIIGNPLIEPHIMGSVFQRTSFSWIRLQEIKNCLDSGMLHSALILALTIPDICAKVEYNIADDKGGKYYQKWFDENIDQYNIGNTGKDEKHFDAGVREDDVKEAQDWFDGITDTEDMIGIAGFDREDYISTDEDGKEEFDEDLVCYDFSNWWDNMDDIEQVKEYRKHE